MYLFADIDKTISELDHVINYYNVSTEVESIIEAGPCGPDGLEAFLQALDKLKQAQSYFDKHNPQSVELENVVSACSHPSFKLFDMELLRGSLKIFGEGGIHTSGIIVDTRYK